METGADDRFEWDPEKNSKNIRKHGLAFVYVTPAFDDPNNVETDVTEDEYGETRSLLIGSIDPVRFMLVVVIFSPLPGGRFRIISARKAEKQDARDYYLRFEGP